MTLALSFFLISFVAILFMVINKMRAITLGRGFVNINPHIDRKLQSGIVKGKRVVKEVPKFVAKKALYFGVKQGVTVYGKAKTLVYPKISHIVDAVKGKDVPKNKGSASFFLGNIEENKKES